MKRYFLMAVMVLNVTAFAVAQGDKNDKNGDGKPDGGRLAAYKIAYLTKKLNLSTEEAQKFWPIYNQYEAEIRKTRQEARANNAKDLDTEEKMLNIRKRYEGEFSKAITKEKVNTFFRAEREFGTEVQRLLLERRQNQLNRKRLRQ